MVAFIVWMDNAERRIPVQYAKRVVGRKMYGGQNTHIPIKVNMSGVMPIIFAGSILSIPPTIQMFIPSAKLADSKFWTGFFKVFTSTHCYGIIYFILIIAFAYFYSSIQYNPIEMSPEHRQERRYDPRYSYRQTHIGLHCKDHFENHTSRSSPSECRRYLPDRVLAAYNADPYKDNGLC